MMRLKLSMITFNMLESHFSNDYGKKNGNGVAMPLGDDSLHMIHNEGALDNYKDTITKKFGDVMVLLQDRDEVWFNKVKIDDGVFQDYHRKYMQKAMSNRS